MKHSASPAYHSLPLFILILYFEGLKKLMIDYSQPLFYSISYDYIKHFDKIKRDS